MQRVLKHCLTMPWHVRRVFSSGVRRKIGQAVTASELHHRGEVRFVVEASLDIAHLLRKCSARQRAVELFAHLGVWDTADNTGVLVYVLFAEHKIEIVADRGIAACVAQAEWDAICAEMARAFAAGQFEAGSAAGLQRITALLTQHFPADAASNPNELPDRIVLL